MTDRIAIPTITDADMAPRTSPYATGKQTKPVLDIDGENRQVTVSEYDPGQTGTPQREWLGFVKSIPLVDDEGGTVEANALENYLNSDEAQALLARFCDGSDSRWDGNNMRPTYTDDALAAFEELIEEIGSLDTETWEIWDAADWLNPANLATDYGLTLATTDAELAEMAEEIEGESTEGIADNVIIEGLEEYLESKRQELRDAWMEEQEEMLSDELTELGACSYIEIVPAGQENGLDHNGSHIQVVSLDGTKMVAYAYSDDSIDGDWTLGSDWDAIQEALRHILDLAKQAEHDALQAEHDALQQ